jgi:uncharacterized repeat protein (TIGR03803 family)
MTYRIILSLSLVAALQAASGPDNYTGNQGTATLLNGFTQGSGYPGRLVETSPGNFAGVATLSGRGSIFKLTSQGTLTSLYAFPNSAIVFPVTIQSVNGWLYGSQAGPWANFSFDLKGSVQSYPQSPIAPHMAVQAVTGTLYGAEGSFSPTVASQFVSMSLSGATTIIHTFTSQEGSAFGYPILASDGNFYGISTLGNQQGSTSSMVYRITPQGTLTILTTYPDGRPNYPPGSFPETVIQASNGKLYGTASLGGSNLAGAIFELSLDGTYKVLHEFKDWDYGVPTFLTQASDGNLYGVTQGPSASGAGSTLFKMTLDGNYQTYYVMNNPNIGTCNCWLTQGSNGLFYGTSTNGGPGGTGTAWTWDLGLPRPLPKVDGMLHTSGEVGSSTIIYGGHLLGATGVSFNGVPASEFYNISNNYVHVTVPSGATTGPVTVTTPNGNSTSSGSFTVE